MLKYFLNFFKKIETPNGVLHRAHTTKYEDLCQ